MKSIIYFLLLIIPILTFSQNDIEKEFFKQKDKLFVGYVATGFNLSQIDGDRSAGYNRIGVNVGVGVFVTYTNNFSNSIEIIYSMKGAKSNFNLRASHPAYFSYNMDYIEIPVLFNYHDFKIAIFHIGFAFTNSIRATFKEQYKTEVLRPYYNRNLDLVIGFTFLIKDHWGLNFKYNYSLLNTLNNGSGRGNLITQSAKVSSRANGKLNWYHNTITFRGLYIF